jgi:hypothetical protein
VPIALKSGSLNLKEPSGPVQACNGIALPLYYYLVVVVAAVLLLLLLLLLLVVVVSRAPRYKLCARR